MSTFIGIVIAIVIVLAVIGRMSLQSGGTQLRGGKKPITLKNGTIVVAGRVHPLHGAQAEAIAGGKAKRLVVGTLPVPVVVVTGTSWSETVEFKDIGKATLAARQINEAAGKPAASGGAR